MSNEDDPLSEIKILFDTYALEIKKSLLSSEVKKHFKEKMIDACPSEEAQNRCHQIASLLRLAKEKKYEDTSDCVTDLLGHLVFLIKKYRDQFKLLPDQPAKTGASAIPYAYKKALFTQLDVGLPDRKGGLSAEHFEPGTFLGNIADQHELVNKGTTETRIVLTYLFNPRASMSPEEHVGILLDKLPGLYREGPISRCSAKIQNWLSACDPQKLATTLSSNNRMLTLLPDYFFGFNLANPDFVKLLTAIFNTLNKEPSTLKQVFSGFNYLEFFLKDFCLGPYCDETIDLLEPLASLKGNMACYSTGNYVTAWASMISTSAAWLRIENNDNTKQKLQNHLVRWFYDDTTLDGYEFKQWGSRVSWAIGEIIRLINVSGLTEWVNTEIWENRLQLTTFPFWINAILYSALSEEIDIFKESDHPNPCEKLISLCQENSKLIYTNLLNAFKAAVNITWTLKVASKRHFPVDHPLVAPLLEALAQVINSNQDAFKLTFSAFPDNDPDLLIERGKLPYEYKERFLKLLGVEAKKTGLCCSLQKEHFAPNTFLGNIIDQHKRVNLGETSSRRLLSTLFRDPPPEVIPNPGSVRYLYEQL